MNNKGQITVFLSFTLCILLLLTLTAFEVIRIQTGRVKEVACVHSMRTAIMADYNEELFCRYGLLFIDPTYGTESNGYIEEKIKDYLDVSLNGKEVKSQGIYQYSIEDICVTNEVGILDNNMKLLKDQIVEYEALAGVTDRVSVLIGEVGNSSETMALAANETEQNAIPEEPAVDSASEEHDISEEVEDPREILSNMMDMGILNIVMPQNTLSSDKLPVGGASTAYEEERDAGFHDIGFLNRILRISVEDTQVSGLAQETAFFNYITTHFSNGVHPYDDTVMKCELEYLLEGKSSDEENMEAVVQDLIWMRMPVNYTYLLTDVQKKEEAEVVAAAICTATGTLEFEKVVQYLLLGCWSYAEAIYDVKDLLSGGQVAFLKTKATWKTDLKTLSCKESIGETGGLHYEDYLLLLFAKDNIRKTNDHYVRMLDVMELNIQQKNPDFQIKNCVGQMDIQGKIILEPLFRIGEKKELYEYEFSEFLSYCKEN